MTAKNEKDIREPGSEEDFADFDDQHEAPPVKPDSTAEVKPVVVPTPLQADRLAPLVPDQTPEVDVDPMRGGARPRRAWRAEETQVGVKLPIGDADQPNQPPFVPGQPGQPPFMAGQPPFIPGQPGQPQIGADGLPLPLGAPLQPGMPVGPRDWLQFGPHFRPPNNPGITQMQLERLRANAMWERDPNPEWTGLGSESYAIARQVLGGIELGAGLGVRRDLDSANHDICNFLAKRYLTAKDRGDEAGAQEALEVLYGEHAVGKTGFAMEAYKRLNYVDAVIDLSRAKTDQERMRALQRIAQLESRFGDKDFDLDRLPKELTGKQPEDLSKMIQSARMWARTEALEQAVKSGDLGKQQEALCRLAQMEGKSPDATKALEKFAGQDADRQAQVKFARLAAKEGDAGVYKEAGVQLKGLMDGDRDGRARPARELEIARATVRGAGTDEFDKTIAWTKALEKASNLLHALNDPQKARQSLDDLMDMKGKGNERAGDVLKALGIEKKEDIDGFIKALSDPEKKYDLIAKVAPKLREFEGQFVDMRTYTYSSGLKPEDILKKFPDQKLVAEARVKAERFARANYDEADGALATLLDRKSSPADREKAIEKLTRSHTDRERQLGRSNFSGPLDWAKGTDAVLKILETGQAPDGQKAAQSLQALQELAKTNPQAAKLVKHLEQYGGIEALTAAAKSGDAAKIGILNDAVKAYRRTHNELDGDALKAARDIEAGSRPQMTQTQAIDALTGLKKLAESGNGQAKLFLQEMVKSGGYEKMLADLQAGKPDAVRKLQDGLRDFVDAGMDSYRIIRIARSLDEKTTPEQWAQAREKLEAEVKAGNQLAGDWRNWAVSQEVVAKLNGAKDNPEAAQKAMAELTAAARDNPYARHTLAMILLATTPDGSQRDARGVTVNMALKDKPMMMPQLKELATSNPDLYRSLQKDALTALEQTVGGAQPNGSLTRAESVALAFHLANCETEKSSKDPAVAAAARERQERLTKFFKTQMDERVPSTDPGFEGFTKAGPGSKAAMEGLHAAMALQAPRAESLADLYLRGADHPAFEIEQFAKNAVDGDLASLRVLSALSGGVGNRRHQEIAVEALKMAGHNPAARTNVMDEMVRGFEQYGDKNALLATLGKVAATGEHIPDHVRDAIRKGVTSSNADTRKSALEGFLAYAPQWNAKDLDVVRKNLTPEMVAGLAANADRIPKQHRDTLLAEAAAKLDLKGDRGKGRSDAEVPEMLTAIATMKALGRYITEDQMLKLAQFGEAKGLQVTNPNYKDALGVEGLQAAGFTSQRAAELQQAAGKAVLNLLGKAEDSKASEAAFNAIGLLKWPQVFSNEAMRDAVVDYVKGRPMSLERLDQIHALVYEAGIAPPTAQILRHWKPGYSDAEYFQRAQVIADNYKTDKRNGDAVIRDVANRVAMWNALEPFQRREITGSDAPLPAGSNVPMAGKLQDPRLFNMLPENVREHLTGSKELMKPGQTMPEFKDKSIPADMFNQLSPSLRRQLTGIDAPLDPRQVEGLMYTKNLEKQFPWLLDETLNKNFEARLKDFQTATAQAVAEQKRLIDDREKTLEALCKQTEKGAGWERLGSYSMFAMGLPGLLLRSQVGDPLDEWDRRQSEMVTAVADGDTRIKEAGDKVAALKPVSDALAFADAVSRYENNVNWGFRKSADLAAVNMLETYGVDVLRQFAPKVYAELTMRSGEGLFGRSGLERLKDNHYARYDTFAIYDADPGKRLTQGLDALKKLKPGDTGVDIKMHRENAIRAIEADPDLNQLANFAQTINVHLGALQRMAKAGGDGTKMETMVADCKRRAAILEQAFKDVTPEQVAAVKRSLKQLQDAEKEITDPEAKKNIQAKIDSLSQIVNMVDPDAKPQDSKDPRNQRKQLEDFFKHIQSRDFDADTFGNWLLENGPVIAAAIAAAAITVASMGTATPLAVILVTSATMLAATQLTKEVLYQINNSNSALRQGLKAAGADIPDSFDTHLGKKSDRSYLGAWVAKVGPQWLQFANDMGNHSAEENLARFMKLKEMSDETFIKDVGGPMLLEYGINVLMGLVTVGVGNIGAQGLKGAAPASMWKALTTKPAAQLTQSLAEVQALGKANPALGKAMTAWMGRVGREGANGLMFVGAQEGIHGGLDGINKALGRQNMMMSFLIAAGLAFTHSKYSAGHNPMRIKANEVHVDTKFMEPLVKACQEAGHTVTKMPNGTYEVRTFNSAPGDPPLVLRTKPTVELQSPHELPREQRQPGRKTSELPPAEAAWMTKGAAEMREGKYRQAYETASNNPALKDVKVERQVVKIDAANLARDLVPHLEAIKGTAEAVVNTEGQMSIKEATTVVKLKSGTEVDVLNPGAEKLSPADQAEFHALMRTPEMQRIMAEHAMCKFEEGFHIQQFQAKGEVISKTYQDYLKQTGETSGDPASRFNRSQRSFEQEMVCALYDAGFPVEAIRQHFGNQYAGRQPVLDYLAQRESGTLGKPAAPRPDAAVPDLAGVPVGREPVSVRRNTDLTPYERQIEAFAKALEPHIQNVAERDAVVNAVKEQLKQAEPGQVANLVQKLEQLKNLPDFAQRVTEVRALLDHPNFTKLQVPLDLVLDINTPTSTVKALNGLMEHPSVKAMVERSDIAGLEAVRQNLQTRAGQPGFAKYLDVLNSMFKSVNPQAKDWGYQLRIGEASLRGVPINMEHVMALKGPQREPINGLVQRRFDLDNGIATGDGSKFGGASVEQMQRMKAIVDKSLQTEGLRPEEYFRQLNELLGQMSRLNKFDIAQRDAALAALERGEKVAAPVRTTPDLPGGWTADAVVHFQTKVMKDVPGGAKIIEDLVAAGVPKELLASMGAAEIMAGPAQLLKARQTLNGQIEGGALPPGMKPEQAARLRESMDALLRGEGATKAVKAIPGGNEAGPKHWSSEVRAFSKLLTEATTPAAGAEAAARNAVLLDILGSVGRVPISVPLEKLAASKYPAENLQLYRDWIAQLEGTTAPGKDNTVMAKALAGSKDPALADWTFVSSEPGSRADTIGIDGIFFNLKTGEVRPVDYKADVRRQPVELTGQLQPFDLHTKGIDFHNNPEPVIRDFLKRPASCGFDPAVFAKALGDLAKDFPGGIPPLRKEALTDAPAALAKMDAYLAALNKVATQIFSTTGKMPPSLYRLIQGTETTVYHTKAKVELSQQLPELIGSSKLKPLPEGGYEIAFDKPVRVSPDVTRRFSDWTPYDVVGMKIGPDGTVTAIRKNYKGFMDTQVDPTTNRPATPAGEHKDGPLVQFDVAKLPEIYQLAKQKLAAEAAGKPELQAKLAEQFKQMDAELARLQTIIEKPASRPALGTDGAFKLRARPDGADTTGGAGVQKPPVDPAKVAAAKNTIAGAELPQPVRDRLQKLLDSDPASAEVVAAAAKMDAGLRAKSGIDRVLTEGATAAEVQLRMRYADMLGKINELQSSDPHLAGFLDELLRTSKGEEAMDASRLALAEQLSKLSPAELKQSRLDWLIQNPEALRQVGVKPVTEALERVTRTRLERDSVGTPSGDVYHDIGMYKGKNAIEGLEGILLDGLIRGSTDKGGQVSQNGGPTNWWESEVTLRISTRPYDLANVGRDTNAPQNANWFMTGSRGTPIDINGKPVEVIINGKNPGEINLRMEQARAAVVRANEARKAAGLEPFDVKVQSIGDFLVNQRFPELARSLPEGHQQQFIEQMKKSPLSAQKAIGELAAQMTPSEFAQAYKTGWPDALANAKALVAEPRPRGLGSSTQFEQQFSKLSLAEQLVFLENVRRKPNLTVAMAMDDIEAVRGISTTMRTILEQGQGVVR